MRPHARLTDPRPASAKELRLIRQDIQRTQDSIAELNAKIKLAPERRDMRSIRVKLLERLTNLNEERADIVSRLEAQLLSRQDLVDIIGHLTELENVIVNKGTADAQAKLRALIDFCVTDLERLEGMGA